MMPALLFCGVPPLSALGTNKLQSMFGTGMALRNFARSGLVAALKRSFQGSAHQRCRVHFARNLLALIPKSHKDMVAAEFNGDGEIDLVINTPYGQSGPRVDGYEIRTAAVALPDLPGRLKVIFDGVREIAVRYAPTCASVEIVFVNVNPQATLVLIVDEDGSMRYGRTRAVRGAASGA